MRESEVGLAHIKSVIDKYLLNEGFDPFSGEMAKIVDASSKAIQELLREYTRAVVTEGRPGESEGM
jgi:hypothetical protein